MEDAVTARMRASMARGKYTNWAKHLSSDDLEVLLWAVGVFGREYNSVTNDAGKSPNPTFAPHEMDERRMRWGLQVMAMVQAGEDPEEETMSRPDLEVFTDPRPAFTDTFMERLSASDSLVWAVGLNDRQLWTLLDAIGEYGIRVGSSRDVDGGEYPPPSFNVTRQSNDQMRRALQVVGAAFGWRRAVTFSEVRKQVFGEST